MLRKHQEEPLTANDIWQRAEITGAPQIARSRGWRRVYKVATFFACVVGMVYQISQFVAIFWSYPMVLEVKVEIPPSIPVPAITVCLGNSINRRKYCRDHPDHCTGPERHVKPEYEMIENAATRELYQKYGLHWLDVHFYNNLGWSKSPFLTPRHVLKLDLLDDRDRRTRCFVLNNQVLAPNFSMLAFPTTNKHIMTAHENIARLVLFIDSRIIVKDHKRPVWLSLHSPYGLVNPYFDGKRLERGRGNINLVRMTETRLLPAPYATDCEDYIGHWYEGSNLPLSRDSCIQKCIAEKALSQCGCFPFGTLYPSNIEFCKEDGLKCLDQVEVEPCYASCRPDCRSLNFHFQATNRDIEDAIMVFLTLLHVADRSQDIGNFSQKTDVILVATTMESNYVISYIYTPKYERVELFMYIGGYLGIWMGISIIEMLDLLDVCSSIFALQRKRKRNIVETRPAPSVGVANRLNIPY